METTDEPDTHDESTAADATDEMPPGDHPLEIAARSGIGPLAKAGREIWHGHTTPCVSCGHLVPRADEECAHCGQDLGGKMIETMRRHAGPWYVLEHVRPFPGVTLDRIVRQIVRGVLTETSIVRGPATDFQWRFAAETPGLARYFGVCWQCHGSVPMTDANCPACLAYQLLDRRGRRPKVRAAGKGGAAGTGNAGLSAGKPAPVGGNDGASDRMDEAGHSTETGEVLSPQESEMLAEASAAELNELREALTDVYIPSPDTALDEPPRIAGVRASWIAAGLLLLVIAALIAFAQLRGRTGTAEVSDAIGMAHDVGMRDRLCAAAVAPPAGKPARGAGVPLPVGWGLVHTRGGPPSRHCRCDTGLADDRGRLHALSANAMVPESPFGARRAGPL